MELTDVFRTVRRYWILVAAVFLIVAGAAGAAALLPADQYQATSSVLVRPQVDDDAIASIQAVEFLMPALEQQAESPLLVETAAPDLVDDLDAAGGTVTAAVDPQSGILRITVEAEDPAVVAPAADSLAEAVIDENPAPELLLMTVLEPARVPTAPSGPARVPVLAGGLVLAAILAVFAALGASAFRRRLDRANEIRSRFQTDVLAEIPSYGRVRQRPSNALEAFRGSSQGGYSEAMLRLRSNLEVALVGRDIRSICVTSAEAEEGKSTVAAALALGLAAVGHDTLLVDSDLRHPSLHALMRDRRSPGLADALTNEPAELLRMTSESNLFFLPAGIPDRHPAEVVPPALERVLATVAAGRGNRPIAIVDAPPLNGAAETTIVAASCDAVILVVDARRRQPEDIEQALEDLKRAGGGVLGVVLNWVRKPHRSSRTYYHAAARPSRKLGIEQHVPAPEATPEARDPEELDAAPWTRRKNT